ncbi:MAG: HAD family phosphatase [Paludibacteraceae bacterium]|nr:HAD family phosphatase [Paludibacteraceae bacterium]
MERLEKQKAYFFDMDGVLFNSMPNHAIAWEEVMKKYGLPFTAYDCYVNEGRTGESVIREAMWKARNRDATPEEVKTIYAEKSARFHELAEQQVCGGKGVSDVESKGGTPPIEGVADVLRLVQSRGDQIWVVTGSGQLTLIDSLQAVFPSVFQRDRIICGLDVMHGKPDPEPYLKAWERSGLEKEQCVVIENAPLGIRSGKAAGLTVYAVNTGILTREDLAEADEVFDSMAELLAYLQGK